MEYEQILKEINSLLEVLAEHNSELAQDIHNAILEHQPALGECAC